MGWLLAVHTGAGRYAACDEPAYLALMRQALRAGEEAIVALSATSSPATAQTTEASLAALVASRVVRVFERSELTNAGMGANLTAHGRVECEATVVCGRSALVSACAKVRGVAEPSALAHALLVQAAETTTTTTTTTTGANDHHEDEPTTMTGSAFAFGRQAPLVVVGKHARELARGFGLDTVGLDVATGDLDAFQVTPSADAHWRKWHVRFQAQESALGGSRAATSHSRASNEAEEHEPPLSLERLDTVGAICVDPFGNVAAALSSGGVAYKVPGRVGLAGCPRMGCNAANSRAATSPSRPSPSPSPSPNPNRKRKHETEPTRRRSGFAVACSGRGEHFIRSSLVAKLSHALGKKTTTTPLLERALRKAFIDGQEDNGDVPIEGGVLALSFASHKDHEPQGLKETHEPQKLTTSPALTVQLCAAFSTPCMGVGFLHSSGVGPSSELHVQILRQPSTPTRGRTAATLSTHVSLVTI